MKIFTLGVKRLPNSLVKKRVQSLLETIIRLENIPQRSQIKKPSLGWIVSLTSKGLDFSK